MMVQSKLDILYDHRMNFIIFKCHIEIWFYVRTSVSANVMTETCHAPKYWKMTLHLLKLLLTFGRCILRPSGQYVLFLSIKSYTCVSKVEKT